MAFVAEATFEDNSVATLNGQGGGSGWNGNWGATGSFNPGNTFVQASVSYQGSQATLNSSGTSAIYRIFTTSLTGTGTYYIALRRTTTGGTDPLEHNIRNSSDQYRFGVALDSDGNMYLGAGGGRVSLGAYSANTWYVFRITYDFTGGTCTAAVSTDAYGTSGTFGSESSAFTMLNSGDGHFFNLNGGDSNTGYFDYISPTSPFTSSFPTQSVDIEGSTPDYLSRTDNALLSPTGSFTLEGWVKFESLPGSGATSTFVAKRDGGANQRSYWFYLNNTGGTYKLGLQTSSTGSSATDTLSGTAWSSPSTGIWYHVGVTYTGGTGALQFEIDGADAGTATSPDTSIFDGTAPFILGNRFEGGSGADPFDGRMLLWRMWKGEARSLANLNSNKCTVLGATTNLSGEWTLNNTYIDNSGNGLTLTPNGMPSFGADVPSTCTVVVNSNFFMFMR